jgi:hypothetical protein
LVLENLPDEPVVSTLEQERDRGRDRYVFRQAEIPKKIV